MSTTNTETGTSYASLYRTGDDITGGYLLTEVNYSSSTVVESDVVGAVTTSATTTANDASSATTSANDVTGNSSTSETASSTATMLKSDSYGTGNADTQTITTVGHDSSYQSSNDITGTFSLSDTSTEQVTTSELGTRSSATFNATSTNTSTAKNQETGNSITGSITTSETTTDSTTLSDTSGSPGGGGYGSAGYTVSQLDLSTSTVTGTENTITGVYSQTSSSNDSTSVYQSSSPGGGSAASASTETTSAGSTGTETGDTITGAYSSGSTQSDSSTLTQSGTNSTGTYSTTATTSETSITIGESGNSISGDYTFSQIGTQHYSFNEASSTGTYGGNGSSFAITETGTKAYTLGQSGSHVTGNYSMRETGTDSFTIAESGGTSSGSGGGGGGGFSGSGSSSSSSSTWALTLAGADNYTIAESGNELSGAFSRTTTGSGGTTLTEGGSLASSYYNPNPWTGYTVAESGNYLSGAISLTETGTDRYGLINGFNNVSNALTSANNGPGDIDYSPVGAPFFIGAKSPVWGHGPNADLNAAASDAAFNELGLQLLHEYCWAGDQPLMVNSEDDYPIESAREGQSILAASEHDPEGPRRLNEVGKFFQNGLKHVIHLYVEGRLFRPTPNHPIYVRERGFVPAGELQSGDQLLTDDHRWVEVSSVVDKGEVVPVFNLMVPNGHTYFVGSKRRDGFCILVHNQSPGGWPQIGAKEATPEDLEHDRRVAEERLNGLIQKKFDELKKLNPSAVPEPVRKIANALWNDIDSMRGGMGSMLDEDLRRLAEALVWEDMKKEWNDLYSSLKDDYVKEEFQKLDPNMAYGDALKLAESRAHDRATKEATKFIGFNPNDPLPPKEPTVYFAGRGGSRGGPRGGGKGNPGDESPLGKRRQAALQALTGRMEQLVSKLGEKGMQRYLEARAQGKSALKAYKEAEAIENLPPSSRQRNANRREYMGQNPNKNSTTYREVVARMRSEGKIVGEGEKAMVKTPDGSWIPLKDAELAHTEDAMRYWNREGKYWGKRHPKVREFMTDSDNYIFDKPGTNRAAGAKLKDIGYDPPDPRPGGPP